MLEWTYTTILMSTKNLHFENSYSRQGIHMSCADGYGHDLDLLPDYLALIAMWNSHILREVGAGRK